MPLRSATCLLLATTVMAESSTTVMYSPLAVSFSASVTLGILYVVSIFSFDLGCEMRTLTMCGVVEQPIMMLTAAVSGKIYLSLFIAIPLSEQINDIHCCTGRQKSPFVFVLDQVTAAFADVFLLIHPHQACSDLPLYVPAFGYRVCPSDAAAYAVGFTLISVFGSEQVAHTVLACCGIHAEECADVALQPPPAGTRCNVEVAELLVVAEAERVVLNRDVERPFLVERHGCLYVDVGGCQTDQVGPDGIALCACFLYAQEKQNYGGDQFQSLDVHSCASFSLLF